MSYPILDVRHLSSGWGDLLAVRDVTFGIHPGEIVALFGPNGAGKTTTLLATVGELPRAEGEIWWKGKRSRGGLHKLARTGLAFVPEAPSIIAGLSTLDNLRIGRGSVDDALALFPELEALLKRRAGLLSGGEQQILAMARSLAAKPECLLIDELSLGLAPMVVDRLMTALRSVADSAGVGVVLVEQQARRALAVADRWYLLSNGRISESHAVDDASDLQAAYLGDLTAANAAT